MSSCDNLYFCIVGVRFPEDSAEDIQKQKQLLKDSAAFLVSCQIPSLVSDVYMKLNSGSRCLHSSSVQGFL